MELRAYYYRILGLSDGASQAEIKRNYRRLAMRYHPDKPTGNSEKFIKIQQAYEYLVNMPDSIQAVNRNTTSSSLSKQERIRRAMERKQTAEYREYIANERYFQELISGKRWYFMRISAIVGAILGLFILLDECLPYCYESDRIVAYERSEINGLNYRVSSARRLYTEKGYAYYVESIPNLQLMHADVWLVKSRLLHNHIAYIPCFNSQGELINRTDRQQFYWIQFSLSAHALLFLPFILLPVVLVLCPKKTLLFTFFYFIGLYLSAPFIYLYLFLDFRWLHLLTLGFI